MSIKNHKDYVAETGRLKDTVTYIVNIIRITEGHCCDNPIGAE